MSGSSSNVDQHPLRLPTIQETDLRQLRKVDVDLLGFSAPNLGDPRREVIILLRDFGYKLSRIIGGQPSDSLTSEDTIRSGLVHDLHEVYERFKTHVLQTTLQFRPRSSKKQLNEETEKELMDAIAKGDEAIGLGIVNSLHIDEVMDLAKR